MPGPEVYAIYGASGMGREAMPAARAMLERGNVGARDYEILFVDDEPSLPERINGHRVLSYARFLALDARRKCVNVAIAAHSVRRMLVDRCLNDGIELFSIVAPNAVIMDDVQLEPGSLLAPFVLLTSNIRVGRCFHANMHSYVAHDCVIGDYVTFAPGVKCNGNVRIEDEAYIGTGAILRQGAPDAPLVIGRGAVVGMGAVVTKSVPPGVTVIGNPARPMQRS